MLKFENVTKSFKNDFWKEPKVILNCLSFKVSPGSLCGFLGANGAGKTTSIKSLLGFIKIDSGLINFDPVMGKSTNVIKSNIGYFPEHPYFYSHMSGREFCSYLGNLQGVTKGNLSANLEKWSKALNIDFALDSKIKTYSKGMLQRLGFTSALLHNPKLIILDEPLSGLDPIGRREFKDVMLELNREGVTVFFSSHIVSDVEEICDSLVVIRDGECFYEGKTETIMKTSGSSELEVSFKSSFEFESIKSKFKDINLLYTSDDVSKCSIAAARKIDFMKFCIEENLDLLEIIKKKPCLEEIIYETSRKQ